MRYPDFLRPGGSIGFIAPSFGCTTEPYKSCFEAALARFRADGFKALTGPNCFRDDGAGKSTSPAACGSEINSFFTGSEADVIISCGGGETMCEDLPYVDFERIGTGSPKWFMGYSDNTNLTFTLPCLCDTAAIYGPNAPAFGARELHASLEDAMAFLKGEKLSFSGYPLWERESLKTEEDPYVPYNLTEPCGITTVSPGQSVPDGGDVSFSGRMIGGCLDCLVNLAGTPWDRAAEFARRYASDGIIWFIESCDLGTMGIRRALWQLKQNGWFSAVSGFIIGRPMRIDDRFGPFGPNDSVLSVLSEFGVPVVLDADLGHLPPSMPFISGAFARVNAGKADLRITYELR